MHCSKQGMARLSTKLPLDVKRHLQENNQEKTLKSESAIKSIKG